MSSSTPPPAAPLFLSSPAITDMGKLSATDWQSIANSHVAASETLLADAKPSEALYLAGFALEVALKGKIRLEGLPIGPKTHSLQDLLLRTQVYRPSRVTPVSPAARAAVGFLATFPPGYTYWQLFTYVHALWDNQLRYNVGTTTLPEGQEFVAAVKELVAWIWSA